MAHYAIIRDSDGLVVNMVIANDAVNVKAPLLHSVILATSDAAIGGSWDGSIFIPLPVPPPEPPLPALTEDEVISRILDSVDKRSPVALMFRALGMVIASNAGKTPAVIKEEFRTALATILSA